MIEDQYLNIYVKISYHILTRSIRSRKPYKQFSSQYCNQLRQIIQMSQLSTTNLIISWYYLYKYATNGISQIDVEESVSLVYHLILTSFVLANKTFDDQCYSCKTWCNIVDSCDASVKCDLRLMNQLETHFLSVVDYKLSFTDIDNDEFWGFLQGIFNDTNLANHVLHSLRYIIMPKADHLPSMPASPVPYNNLTSPLTASFKSPLTPLTPFSLDRKRTYTNMEYCNMEKMCHSINLDDLTNFQFEFLVQ